MDWPTVELMHQIASERRAVGCVFKMADLEREITVAILSLQASPCVCFGWHFLTDGMKAENVV